MRRETTQVPLLEQPPVYIVLAVVLVSLVPLGFRLLGSSLDGAAQQQRAAMVEPALVAVATLEPMRVGCPTRATPAGEASEPVIDDAPLSVIAMALEEAAPDDEPVEIIVIDDPEDDRRPASARGLLGKAKRAIATGRPDRALRYARWSNRRRPTQDALLLQTKAACELEDRRAARTAYHDLPRGDVRREARKACRAAGILLL